MFFLLFSIRLATRDTKGDHTRLMDSYHNGSADYLRHPEDAMDTMGFNTTLGPRIEKEAGLYTEPLSMNRFFQTLLILRS